MSDDQVHESALYAPPLIGKRVSLMPVRQVDHDFLYDLWMHPSHTFLWRFRGATPGPDAFRQTLWHNVLCQFLLVVPKGGTEFVPVGLISAYNADLRNDTAYLSMVLRPDYLGTLVAHDAMLLFVNYLFTGWRFRKLYGETSERHLGHVFPGAVDRYVRVEGTLVQHEYFNGRYWDAHVVALYREDWQALIDERLRRVLPEPR